MIYVTHDQVEAMTMADKIVVLDLGAISQIGAPLELYNRPANLFVARFIGSPTMNLVKGASAAKRGADCIGIRPEHTEISTTAGEWPGTVRVAEHLGSETFVYVDVGRHRAFHRARRRRSAAACRRPRVPKPARAAPAQVQRGRAAHRRLTDLSGRLR